MISTVFLSNEADESHKRTLKQYMNLMQQSIQYCYKFFIPNNNINNMIKYISIADCVVIISPTNLGSSSNIRNIKQQMKICYTFGIKQIAVCINQTEQIQFKQLKIKLSKMLTKVGYKTNKIPFIPINVSFDINITKKPNIDKLIWYNGFNVQIKKQNITGYTLFDILKNVFRIPNRNKYITNPFRLQLYEVSPMKCKVTHGIIQIENQNKYMKCCVYPHANNTPNEYQIFHIKKNGKHVSHAQTGDIITLNIKAATHRHIDIYQSISVGDIICAENNVPNISKYISAIVHVQSYKVQSVGRYYCEESGDTMYPESKLN
eukprot:257141_1